MEVIMPTQTKENKIKEIAQILIPKQLRFNLLHLVSDVCINRKEPLSCDSSGEVLGYTKEVESLTAELSNILTLPMDKRSDYCHRIVKLQKELAQMEQVIYTYNRFKMLIFELALDEKTSRHAKKENALNGYDFDCNAILNDCLKYVFDVEEDYISEIRKGKLLSCLPLKMLREKYNDCLKSAFENIFDEVSINLATNDIEMLKISFAPMNVECYGKKFNYIADELQSIWEIDFENVSDDELDEYVNNLTDTELQLDEIKECVSSLYNDTNYLLNIALFSVDNEYLFEDDIMFKDLYFSTRNIIESSDNEVLIDDILDRIYDNIECMQDELEAMNSSFNDILEMIDENNVPEDVDTYILTKLKIDENFHKEGFDDMLHLYDTENSDTVNSEFLSKKTEEFLAYIKSVSEKMTNKRVKFLKAKLFENLACFMEDSEYENYLDYVFESLNSDSRKEVYIAKIARLFENEHFDVEDDDHCDCGHEHHHHDHCDCGHEHHHH